jgi:hypothetical protein
MLRRNVAEEATPNFATWWMDLGMTGWFNDARMWEEMSRLDAVDRVFLEKPIPYRREVAAFRPADKPPSAKTYGFFSR